MPRATQVLGTVPNAVGGNSPALAGLQVTKDGRVTFDSAVFTAKFTGDPATVQSILTSIHGGKPLGVAAKLEALGITASNSITGTVTRLATGQDARITELQTGIAAWDTRLALRQKALTDRFTAMTTALGTLQNQSSWLASLVMSLPTWAQPAKR
jgi:flagellar capping protein FliD